MMMTMTMLGTILLVLATTVAGETMTLTEALVDTMMMTRTRITMMKRTMRVKRIVKMKKINSLFISFFTG